MSTRWCELESSTKCFLFLSTFFDTPITTYLLNAVGMCLSYAKGIYHINIEFILNGSKISLSSKEHEQTTISNVLYKTIAVLHDFTKKTAQTNPK